MTAFKGSPVPLTTMRSPWCSRRSTSGSAVSNASSSGRLGWKRMWLPPPSRSAKSERRVDRDHTTRVDQRDAIAQPLGLVHEVCDQHDRHAPVPDAFDQSPRLPASLRVKTCGQFVEDRDLRVADQRQRGRQALLLSAREALVVVAALRGQIKAGPAARGRPAGVCRTTRTGRPARRPSASP
jgi:hypothetical protein